MPDSAPNNFRLHFALERIQFVRAYTLPLLKDIKAEDWFRQPQPGSSQIAWQVGHMAVAQYHMVLFCVRGAKPIDAELIPETFRPSFWPGLDRRSRCDPLSAARRIACRLRSHSSASFSRTD